MRISLLIFILGISLYSINLFSQTYQLPNGGFELWDGNGVNDEPTNWNSFPSAACDLTGLAALGCSSATSTRHAKSTDTRPGSSGTYSCKIYATKISALNVIANGNVTTGQIRIGSTTASNAENYNITRNTNSNFRQSLNAKPDSIVFWAKFICPSETQHARMSATIHDNYSYRDPETNDPNSSSHVVGKAIKNFTRENQTWKRYSLAFDYNFPANNPEYILLTFTTNKEPGAGSESDVLYIDDIEFIYNTKLQNLLVNGIQIPNFSPNTYDYYINAVCGSNQIVSAISQSPNASLTIQQATNSNLATVNVSSGDKTSVYKIHFNFSTTTYISDEICQGETYINNGFNIPAQNSPGLFNFTINTYESETCDSIVVLNLMVNPIYTTDINIMICENAEYNFFEQIVSLEGTYQHILNSISGCDSIIKLNLEVGSYYRTFIEAEICEGETYNENGFNLNTQGSDTLIYIAQNDCDSLVILNLSVNPNFAINIADTINQEEIYNQNGFYIGDTNIEGDFEFVQYLLSETMCDSIVTLFLHILAIEQDSLPEPEPETEFNFTVYPIPTSENLNINSGKEINKELDYEIYDIFGRKAMKGKLISAETIIDISNLASGVYFIKITYPVNKTLTYKILIN